MRLSRVAVPSVFALFLAVPITQLTFPQQLGAQEEPGSSDIIIQHDVPMKTRDGVKLYADIYRPKSSINEKFPWDPLESTCRHASLSIL